MTCILIVEDHQKLRTALQQGLAEESYDVLAAPSAEVGMQFIKDRNIDALILDRMLPGRDGVDVLRELRANGFSKPVLMLTARDQIQDRISGLDAGADDYLVKPFDFGELLARLRALLRRRSDEPDFVLRADDLEVDLLARRVVRAGRAIELTRREFDLLEYLLKRRNQTVKREELARELWHEDIVLTNVIDVTVMQLRRKIERIGDRALIQTVRGIGYVLRDHSWP